MNPTDLELLAALGRVVAAFGDLGVDYFVGGFGGHHRVRRAPSDGRRRSGRAPAPRPRTPAGRAPRQRLLRRSRSHPHGDPRWSLVQSHSPRDDGESRRVRGVGERLRPLAVCAAPAPRRGDRPAPRDLSRHAQDTVLAKLDWFRKGGEVADGQWPDVLGVLKVQAAALDYLYLRDWAARLGLSDLLRRALDDAGRQRGDRGSSVDPFPG
jgi:hypothetical protein